MIHVTIKTKRVYSHTNDGMPKFEVISNTVQDGAEFNKFIKYLPYQNYIPDGLCIEKVIDNGKEIDKSEWENVLKKAIAKIGHVEPSVSEKLEAEQNRNKELEERLAKLEEMLLSKEAPKVQQKEEKKLDDDDELEAARDEYLEKVGKRPYHGWDIETLKEKIKEKINGN